MVSFLALLPRSLTTFLYAVAALLRFYGNTDTIPIPRIPLTILDWSLLAFALGTASLLVNLSLEWNAGNRSRAQAEDARTRSRQREARQDDLADRERNKADRERERSAARARIQNRWIILEIRHQLTPSPETRAALTDLVSFLQEYGE
jgi:hypothetical protein